MIRHLECFVAVAEESHFGRAAARLGMAQPPLSQRIQRLEGEFGLRLFDRSSRRVSLTNAGVLLLPEVRALLERSQALQACARRIRDGRSDLLRAALPPDLAGPTVAALLAGFRGRHTGVELELHELATAEQLAGLRAGELDAGLVHLPCEASGLELGPVLRRELGVLLPPDADAAALDEVPLCALAGYDLVLFPRAAEPARYDGLLNSCAREGYVPDAVRHGQGESFVHGLVLSGRAVAFAPRTDREAAERGGGPDGAGAAPQAGPVWRPLVGAPLARRYAVAWPAGRDGATVGSFVEAIGAALRDTAGAHPDTPARTPHLRPTAEFWL
ncbi:DNA-binding transcriptional regulator, LysR family [Actinacidiphila alni]|uniref:DNA-binding transcriptional regulator, LysR family n=2 Tax=Actinacidiphila alni TaxID=380248 RepID=A0A1I2H202_9ACTN|nr:DNA-binding transcriptional regulator, LysR family [Actinacidiphila alni]